jgi:predicted ATPase/DNA-binding CsgD family transcriptional regulator
MALNEMIELPELLTQASDSAFIGRSDDVDALRDRLLSSGCRLLTLIGPGGMGKSRLAKRVIQDVWQHYPDGVFVSWLAPLHDPKLLAQAIADSLSLQIQHDDVEAELCEYLRPRKLLLYIDNFESLVDAAPLLTRLLDAAPELQILVTSRIALNLRYEWLYEVHGMAFDETYGEAQQLFIDRARLNRDRLTESELHGIQNICELVEGMPLAIVLAAGWLRTLPIETIANEIEHGLDLLKTRDRDWEERHRSIRTVFDSSWKLLADNERRIMQRFGLFCGGASAEALREVTGATVDVLADLVDQSMITRDAEGRYQITELLRQYAEEQFLASADFEEGSASHAAYFLKRFMPQMEPMIKDRRHLEAMKRIEADFHNIDTAWTYALENADLTALDAALESLHFYTEIREKYIEGSTMLRSAAECAAQIAPGSREAARLQSRWMRFKFLRMPLDPIGLEETLASIDRLLEVFERVGDVREQAYCWYLKGVAYAPFPLTSKIESEDAAIQAFDRATALFQAVGDDFYTSEVLNWSACRFETENGMGRLQQALQIQEKLGEPNITAWTLKNLAMSMFVHQRFTQAVVYYEKAKAAMKRVGSAKGMIAVGLLGIEFLILNGDYAQVSQDIDEMMAMVEARYPQGRKALLGIRALKKAVADNDYLGAAMDAEQSRLMRTELVPITDVSAWWGIAVTLCSNRDYDRFRKLFRLLTEWGWIFKGTESVWLMCEALALSNDGEHRRAAEYLGAAIATAEATSTSSKRWFDPWQVVGTLGSTLRAELGAQQYDAAIDAGMELSVARLIEEMGNRQNLSDRDEVNRQLADPLTERELQVLDLIRQGMSNNDIAEQLVIAVETVKVHARNIYSKLGVSGRGRAVETARQLGLIA